MLERQMVREFDDFAHGLDLTLTLKYTVFDMSGFHLRLLIRLSITLFVDPFVIALIFGSCLCRCESRG